MKDYHALEITLTGTNNKTLKGVLNFTALDTGSGILEEEEIYDSKGAATLRHRRHLGVRIVHCTHDWVTGQEKYEGIIKLVA